MNSLAHAWTSKLSQLYANERSAMVEFLLALLDFDKQRLWEPLGHAGLFTFLHRELGMSKGQAHYRKTACELIRRFPQVVEPLRDGRLCITSLLELAKVIDEVNCDAVLPRFYGCSRREAEKVAVSIAPVAAPPMRDVVRPLAPRGTPAVQPVELDAGVAASRSVGPAPGGDAPLFAVPVDRVQPVEPIASSARPALRDEVKPLSADLYRVAFTAPSKLVEHLEQVKDELARDFPEGDLGSIFHAGLKLLLEKADKRKALVKTPRAKKEAPKPAAEQEKPVVATPDSRHIPAAEARAVWKRDGKCCRWPTASGGVCGSKRYLELDHIIPFAMGGRSTADNLRVTCASHNQQAARQAFGAEWMARFSAQPPRPSR